MSVRLEHAHTTEGIAKRLARGSSQSYLKDAIYGAIDGAVTTFAVVSGVAGAGLASSIIVILGLANLVADGFSMAAANFLGTRAENQQLDKLRQIERKHIELCPEGEREEIRQILMRQGFHGRLLEEAVDQITDDESTWIDAMLQNEYGVSLDRPAALPAATVTFVSFLVVGSLPLLPFLSQWFLNASATPFASSAIMTAIAFFAVGAIKSRFVAQHWLRSGLETLVVGTCAASLAYFCGYALAELNSGSANH